MDYLKPPPQYNSHRNRTHSGLWVGSPPHAASSFTPASLTNYGAWWDFSNTGTLTSATGGYSQVNDVGGNGQNPTQSSSTQRPDSTTLNSLNAAHFVTGDNMQYNIVDINQGYSQWCIFKLDAAHANNHTIFGDPVSGNQSCLFCESSVFGVSTFGGNVQHTTKATDTNTHLFASTFNGASSTWWIDALTGTWTASTSVMRVANIGAWSTNSDLVMAECGYTTGVMTGTEAANLRAYAQAKWAAT